MNEYQAVAPNGEVFTRKSKRAYTHAVLATIGHTRYTLASFATSYQLAKRGAAEAKRWNPRLETLIVEVSTGLNVKTEVHS